MENIGDSIYSGTATIGKIKAILVAIIFTIISIGLVYIGVKSIFTKDTLTSTVPGVVTKIDCDKEGCDLEVEYTVNGKVYTLKEDNAPLVQIPVINQTVTIYFDPTNPNSARSEELNPKQLGSVYILIALIFLVFSWVGVWLTNKFKFYAAAEGAGTIFDLFR